jgi:hypothetical protein
MIIPKFKNTEHAIQWVRKNYTDSIIPLLQNERQRLIEQFKFLISKNRESDALYLASGQAQFVREALQEAVKIQEENKTLLHGVIKYICIIMGFIGNTVMFIMNGIISLYGFLIMAICAGLGFVTFLIGSFIAIGVLIVAIGLMF